MSRVGEIVQLVWLRDGPSMINDWTSKLHKALTSRFLREDAGSVEQGMF